MFWADAIETDLDRLRRYAAFACGSQGAGDNLVCEALEDFFQDVSSSMPTDLVRVFRRLDEALRAEPQGHADTFAQFGRWQFLQPLERRLVLLITIEHFSVEEAASIVGVATAEAKALLGRVRMKYADRFPARMGLAGAADADRDRVSIMLSQHGHRLLWSIGRDMPVRAADLEPPSAVIVAEADDLLASAHNIDIRRVARKYGIHRIGDGRDDFEGPVILVGGEAPSRINSQVWTMPASGLSDPQVFNRTLAPALLFSA